MTNTNNKRLAKRPKILYTTPVTIDQRAVKASERVFGSAAPLREKGNIKRPTRKRK